MILKPRKLTRWNVRCLENGHQTTTYVFGDTYGYLMGRTPHNELVGFDTWEEADFFEEVGNVVSDLLGQESSHCFKKVLGLACDPAPSGNLYSFTGKLWCPICGSTNLKYGPDNPLVVEVIDLPQVSHSIWDKRSTKEKQNLIEAALRETGCLPWDQYLENLRLGKLRDW